MSLLPIECTSGSRQDVLHVSDIVLLQMLVKEVINLQPDNEHGCNNIVATVINHDHLILKITDVVLEGLTWLHLDCDEVIVVPLDFLSQGILVEENVANLLKASDRPQREGI